MKERFCEKVKKKNRVGLRLFVRTICMNRGYFVKLLSIHAFCICSGYLFPYCKLVTFGILRTPKLKYFMQTKADRAKARDEKRLNSTPFTSVRRLF